MGVYDYDPATPADLKWSEQHLYGSSRLGMWRYGLPVPTATTAPAEGATLYDEYKTGSRTYEMSNHLGNVLATISDKKLQHIGAGNAVDYYLADVVNQHDYYPFGMLQPGRSYGTGYRYGFNGKENDNEVKGEGNQQDYGMRIYDGRLGKFLSVDPLTKKFPELTPYQFASNRPIDGVDLDGLEYLAYHTSMYRLQFQSTTSERNIINY